MPLTKYPRYSSSEESTDRMKYKYLLLILLFTGQGGISYSQLSAESNSSAVNSLIDDGTVSLRNKLIMLGENKSYVFTYDKSNPEADYIARRVQTGLQGFRIIWGEDYDSADHSIKMDKADISVKYGKLKTDNMVGDKTMERQVKVSIGFLVYDNSKSAPTDSVIFSERKTARMRLDALPSYEDSSIPFLRGVLPQESSMSGIVVPAIMLGVSAAAIILFFSIRSK